MDSIIPILSFKLGYHYNFKILFFSFGSLFIVLSIYSGLKLSIVRLLDFRLSRHLALIRKRAFNKDKKLHKDDPKFEDIKKWKVSVGNLKSIIKNWNDFAISINDFNRTDEDFEDKYETLKAIGRSLGKKTWESLWFQYITFTIGVVLYGILFIIS